MSNCSDSKVSVVQCTYSVDDWTGFVSDARLDVLIYDLWLTEPTILEKRKTRLLPLHPYYVSYTSDR